MRKLLLVCLILAAFCSGLFGGMMLNVHAEEKEESRLFFTSIQIQQGDSLWDIAEKYAEGSGYTVSEYVEEMKRMNGLRGDDIHAGSYLTVIYQNE